MPVTRDAILNTLARLALPDGGNPVFRDMARALSIEGGAVRFVVEAELPELFARMEPLRVDAEEAVRALPGVQSVSVVLTAHGPAAKRRAPDLKIGRHPAPGGVARPAGVDRILAVTSGKGGMGESTVSSNLAVALARQGRRVGLLDADIYGPSQPRMMGCRNVWPRQMARPSFRSRRTGSP